MHLLCDEIKETNPEKAERVREILNKEGPSGARKKEADMRRAEKGSQQGVEGSAGGNAGKLTNGRSSKEKAEDQKVERNVLKNEGMVRRELHRKIPQQYKVIQKLREQMQEEGMGEEDIPREWWHKTWKSQYPWLKQIRPILDIWKKRDKIKANYETLMKTT